MLPLNIRLTMYIEYFSALALSMTLSTITTFAFELVGESDKMSGIELWADFSREFPMALLAGIFSFLILIFFYYASLRGISLPIKILITVVATPILSTATIIFAEAILLAVYKELNIMLLNLLILASIYASTLLSILLLSGVLATRIRSFIFLIYGSFLGSVSGMALPLAVVVTTCLITSFFDAYAINVLFRKEMRDLGSRVSHSKDYVSKLIEVGLGDFIFISIIPAMTYYRFGLFLSLFSSALIFIGWMVNLVLILRRDLIAGLPIPVVLGLLPSIVLLISYAA